METKKASNIKNGRYYLQTYGFRYPTPVGCKKEYEPLRLFRPVEYYNGDESSDEELDAPQPGSGDSAYSSQSDPSGRIEVKLHKRSLWKAFMNIGNEMIVTKPGRSLFPTLLVSIRGLDPKKEYSVLVRVAPADSLRYKYLNMRWCAVGESDVVQNEEKQILRHASSPNNGMFWMRKPISFKNIKITNNSRSKNGNILLHTMNKYVLKVIICPTDNSKATIVTLPETTFIAVSAYQSMEVTQMKIDNNPFAKAFKYQDRTTPTVSGVLKSITQKNPDFAKAIGRPSLLAKHNIITTVNSSKPASQVPMTTVAEVKLTAAIVQPALATAVGKKTDLGMEMDTNVNQKVGQVSQTTNGGQGGLPTAVIQNPGSTACSSTVCHSLQPLQLYPPLVTLPAKPSTTSTNTTTTTTHINPLLLYPSLFTPKLKISSDANSLQKMQSATTTPLTPPIATPFNPIQQAFTPSQSSPAITPSNANPVTGKPDNMNSTPQPPTTASPLPIYPLLTPPLSSANAAFTAINGISPFYVSPNSLPLSPAYALQSYGVNPYFPLLSPIASPLIPPLLSSFIDPRFIAPVQQPPPPQPSRSPSPSLPPTPESPTEIVIDV